MEFPVRFSRAALVLFLLVPAAPAAAQTGPPKVAVLNVALYTAGANLQEPSDSGRATLATAVLRHVLDSLLGAGMVDSAAVEARARTAAATVGGDHPCNVIVACARATGQALGARWVVMAKVSKTSNLIWLLTGQLIDVPTGKIVMDDSTELKGDPEPMIRAGVRIFAERVSRMVRTGRAEGSVES